MTSLDCKMFSKIIGIVAFSTLTAFAGYAQTAPRSVVVMAKVFEDTNRNAIYDKGEKRVSKALVSNGVDVVSTNAKGLCLLKAQIGQSIFPILASDYQYANDSSRIGNANFLYLDPMHVYPDTVYLDIPLLKNKRLIDRFKMGAIGDVQVDNEEELGYAAKSIFTELQQREDLAFNVFLGDLVNDNMRLFSPIKGIMNRLSVPSWTIVGNHDRNVETPGAMNDIFNRTFGADSYAFNFGGVHFVMLNNVFATGKNSYEGRVSADQMTFLANDLKYVPKHTTVVISQHIPLAFTHNRKELLALLDGYDNVLVLTGHTHTVNRFFYNSTRIHELGVGATCGNWWRGEKDAFGVPEALMQCGTPRGYFTVAFDKGKYEFRYKGVGMDAQHQMSLEQREDKLVTNIYGGSDSTTVMVQIEGGAWLPMEAAPQVDLRVNAIVEKNQSKVFPTAGSTANPLRKRASQQLWQITVPESKDYYRTVRVKATDAYGLHSIQEFLRKF